MKKTFSASHWFVNQKQVADKPAENNIVKKQHPKFNQKNILAPFKYSPSDQIKFESDMNKFFIPGWKGESLISKNIKEFVKILDLFHKDVYQNLLDSERFSKKQKQALFEEFISFAEFKTFQCTQMDNTNLFWEEFNNPDSIYRNEIDQFINIFSFRISVIYLLKVRFILTLLENTDIEFSLKSILYPNSFLKSVFKPASSNELKARSLEQNIFSWYRPSHNLQSKLLTFKDIYSNITITEIIKTVALKSENILAHKSFYSHSLSNKQFGLYLNSLLINFPLWLGSLHNKATAPFRVSNKNLEIISCKFSGDYLESIALSHWLAQDNNKDIKWEQFLCPDFKSDEFESGLYLKILNELQFLTFLAEIAPLQGHDTKSFICNIVNYHLYNRKSSNDIQKSLFFNEQSLNHSTYDRVILNLTNYPSNNPQHYLYQKILSQKQFIKENGYIFVLTSKKIFVPSQKNKVSQLLKELKVEGVFDLSEIEGKGEVGSFLYVFSNKDTSTFQQSNEKHTCLSLRYHSKLNCFHEFENITHITHDFFTKNLGELPPMVQLYNNSTRLEFYQDAIVDGQLIHSTSKDSNSITHPNFFKKLMNLCQPLDYFFELQSIDFNSNFNRHGELLLNNDHTHHSDISNHVIIVDQRQKNKISIEIINSSLLEAKAYDYGHAMCSYFYAISKWPKLNVFAIEDFLNSSVGSQIINLTFNNEIRKVKGNLNKVLIPTFYINDKQLPEHIESSLKLFSYSPEELLNIHPQDIEKNFSELEYLISKIAQQYPAQVLNILTTFKKTVSKTIDTLESHDSKSTINFNNPLLKSPLLLSKTYPIYPDNDEIYIDFSAEASNLIHSNFSFSKVIQKKIGDETSHGIELYAENTKVVSIYSDVNVIAFLDFIFEHAKDVPLSRLLQSASVPSIDDLSSIINSYKLICKVLVKIQDKIAPLQNRLLSSSILSENKNSF